MKKLLILLCVAAASAAAQTPAPPDTTRPATKGVYTEEQSARGDTVFQKFCLACHTPSSYSDSTFRANWFGRTVFDLFKTLKSTMPEDNIGGLTDDEYTRVIAYILKLNGFPAGADSLRADSIATRRIRIGSDTTAARVSPPSLLKKR